MRRSNQDSNSTTSVKQDCGLSGSVLKALTAKALQGNGDASRHHDHTSLQLIGSLHILRVSLFYQKLKHSNQFLSKFTERLPFMTSVCVCVNLCECEGVQRCVTSAWRRVMTTVGGNSRKGG